MRQLRRVVRFFLLVVGILTGILTALTAYFVRMLIRPPRQKLWATPADLGMAYEDVQFPARDGIRLAGWFIPAAVKNTKTATGKANAATIIIVHSWPWNRLGTSAETVFIDIPGSSPVQLIHLAYSLHHQGYNLLMFDLRNHGQSADSPPVTFGLREADDLLGAVDYLARRGDVDQERIGAISFAVGANATIFALPRTDNLKAVVAVQPSSPSVFSERYASNLLGPLGSLVLRIAQSFYLLASGLRFSAIEPAFATAGAGNTPVLYVQGTGDRWGSLRNVQYMADHTPNAVQPLFIETPGCYGGYQYVVENPEVMDAFFREQFNGSQK